MSVILNNKSNLIKLIFAIFLALPISYINFYQLNFHGDYNFFKDFYNNFEVVFILNQFVFITNTGTQIDPLLVLIFFISQYIFSYELFVCFISIFLFYIFIDFIYLKKNYFIFFLLIISSYYIFAISAASPKNIFAIIFFILSLKNFDNKRFYVYYYCSFLIHSAASIIFFMIIFIFLEKNFFKIFFDKIRLIILLIPILINFFSIYDKIYGYNTVIKNTPPNNTVLLKEFDNTIEPWITIVEKINNIVKKKYIFKVIDMPMSLRSLLKFDQYYEYSKSDFNLTLSLSIFDLLKISLLSIIIISLNSNYNYNYYLGVILIILFVGLGFPRIYMYLHLLIIYLIIKSNINLIRLSFYSLIIYFYIFYFFIKNILFFITFYTTGYIYL